MTDHPVSAILSRWPSRTAVHEDARHGDEALDLVAVHRWFQRNSIPPKHWAALVEGARRRGFALSPDELLTAHGAKAPASDHVGLCGKPRTIRKRGAA